MIFIKKRKTSMKKYHYVYRITNTVLRKHYYGSRTSKIRPNLDLGVIYFSSSTDKNFLKDQKLNQKNYKYVIVRIFENRNDALLFEVYLHGRFNVAKNDNFYNKSQQTSSGFMYGCLGKNGEKNIRNKIINNNGDTLYKLSAKKGSLTKRNTITSNGLNTHQNAAKKYKERLDIVRDGQNLSTREKLKKPKKDKTNYQKEAEIINIYDNNNNLIYKVTINLRKFCKINNLPYVELYNSKRNNIKLYERITDKRVISRLINKDYYKYLGWYAIKQ
jgi:hypothetical protein